MPGSASQQQQRSFHLKRLDRFLNRMGTFGTALIDPDDTAVDDHDSCWTGLLVWNIADGAKSGIVIRCNPGLPAGAWRYCHDNGVVIAGVFEQLKVLQELSRTLLR